MECFTGFFLLFILTAGVLSYLSKKGQPQPGYGEPERRTRAAWQTNERMFDQMVVLDMAEDGFFMPDGEKAFDDRYYQENDAEDPYYE